MMKPEKMDAALTRIQVAALAVKDDNGAVGLAFATCEKALKRIAKRAEEMAPGYEQVEIVPTHGPALEFTGTLLADAEFGTKGEFPLTVSYEIWATKGGALIAVSFTEPDSSGGFERAEAAVIEAQDDAQAMHIAVMEFFKWNSYARSMVKPLGWSLVVEVE